jgi:uncharacterized peroxidase-related enzyme
MKAWIKYLNYEESSGKLREIYDRIKGPKNYLDNILKIHSLRPHTLEGHMKLYKYVLHHSGNKLPKSLLEMLGVYVSFLNKCDYCVKHHFEGLKRLLKNEQRAEKIWNAITVDKFNEGFSEKEIALIHYAKELTLNIFNIDINLIIKMKEVGLDDGEILEANQVISYFNYANRTVSGLGVTTDGDILGLSPNDSDNPDNWSHK